MDGVGSDWSSPYADPQARYGSGASLWVVGILAILGCNIALAAQLKGFM